MEWKDQSTNPLLLKNYDLLKKIGILDYIEDIKREWTDLEDLMVEAYGIFTKESVDDIITFLIKCLSDRFIPSTLVFILSEGSFVNKVKSISFRNLKKVDLDTGIYTLDDYKDFFKKYPGTISYHVLEYDITDEKLLKPFKDLNAEIIVPINGHSGLLGFIIFGPKILDKEYTAREVKYIDKLMRFVSVGIQNNLNYELSVKDLKTGLYNHNFFINCVKNEIAISKRKRRPFSLVIMDIDYFKKFNDTYGHLAGDEAIIQVSNILQKEFRESDTLSRFGGEEFTVLFPDTTKEEALYLAERARESIEKLNIRYNDEILNITISLGVCNHNWYENIDSDEIIKRADEALYKSKERGRNRVSTYRSGLLYRASMIEHK